VVLARGFPLSTYRLQLNGRFTFSDAHDVVDYLHALGVSDCYASSYLKAVPGSPHGYDVADPTRSIRTSGRRTITGAGSTR
jgi:(1->4)-alpha-D-glucan 1-alpha-D-glucosylmutase